MYSIFVNVYLFILEREKKIEREREGGRESREGTERKGDRESQTGSHLYLYFFLIFFF